MSNDNSPNFSGKKIFFLYPSPIIQHEVGFELIQQEYEIYGIKDHTYIKRALELFPDSILFINLDEQMSPTGWETWITELTDDPALSRVSIGVLSSTSDPDIKRKYITSNKIQHGFITLHKTEVTRTVQHIYNILQEADARGRRKYIRANTEQDANTTINIALNRKYLNGIIRDISVVGFSCIFHEDPELEKNLLCRDIQLKLQSMLLKVEGVVFGTRMDGERKIYVFLFSQRIDPDVRIKIRTYIQSSLQAKMDQLLKTEQE